MKVRWKNLHSNRCKLTNWQHKSNWIIESIILRWSAKHTMITCLLLHSINCELQFIFLWKNIQFTKMRNHTRTHATILPIPDISLTIMLYKKHNDNAWWTMKPMNSIHALNLWVFSNYYWIISIEFQLLLVVGIIVSTYNYICMNTHTSFRAFIIFVVIAQHNN